MKSDYWNNFYQSGKVTDYLRYVDSTCNSTELERNGSDRCSQSYAMETVQYAGKSDGNGALGHVSW